MPLTEIDTFARSYKLPPVVARFMGPPLHFLLEAQAQRLVSGGVVRDL